MSLGFLTTLKHRLVAAAEREHAAFTTSQGRRLEVPAPESDECTDSDTEIIREDGSHAAMAMCGRCGWTGPRRTRRTDAERDAYHHAVLGLSSEPKCPPTTAKDDPTGGLGW